MKSYLLFPHYFRTLGVLLVIPGFILGYLFLNFHYNIPGFGPTPRPTEMIDAYRGYTNELALTLPIAGLAFIAFARLKNEDELTAQLRLNALYWAILINYLAVIAFFIFLYVNERFFGYTGGNAQILDYNLFMPLVFFIVRFYYLLYKNRNVYYIKPLHFLPYKPFNKIAKIIAVPCIILFIARVIYDLFLFKQFFSETPEWYNYSDFVVYLTPLIGLVWCYTKERIEDEYINSLRLQAMQIAVYINCIVLLLANFSFYSFDFFVFEIIALSILPLIFIITFQYKLYYLSKNREDKNRQTLNLKTL